MAQSLQGPPAAPVRRLGDFTIVDEIGRGGMGIVYRARQESMGGRIVALKVLPSFVGRDADSVARFRREAEAAGRLSHPGIVPIYAVGEQDGVHYYAMEFVDGPSLHSLIESLAGRAPDRLLGSLAEESALDEVYPGLRDVGAHGSLLAGARYARSCAQIVAEVAAALAVAHQGRVIHRDIKPSNILIHPSGRPVLVDFGLARDESMVGLTQSGDALGTPSYMAPEQACGHSSVDARVDVYGLGATLYELLTLRPPFEGAHPGEIMRKIVEEEPAPIRQLNSRVPFDLATIVANCLAKDPDERYPAIEALEMDLRAFLGGRPVLARRPGMRVRLCRFVGRHRLAVLVGLIVFVLSVAGFLALGWILAERARGQGRTALANARDHVAAARFDLAFAEYGRAAALLDESEVAAARVRHRDELFEGMYAAGRHAELRGYLERWEPADRDAGWLSAWERVLGHGTLNVPNASDPGVVVRTRRIDPERRLTAWEPLDARRRQPIGQYLVEVEAVGRAPAVHAVSVERDRECAVVPLQVPLTEVPEGMALVVGEPASASSFVDRTEFSCARYQRLLASLPAALARELRPADWSTLEPPAGSLLLPVSGLSFRQARAAAALSGGHLLAAAEFERAAHGGLASLEYPWGTTFDWSRVAASEDGLPRALPVDSLDPAAASPLGVLHLVGNVAEILSAGPDGAVTIAGGHYQSAPGDLTIASRVPLARLDEPQHLAGFRTARFVPAEPDAGALALAEAIRTAVLGTGQAGVFHDWRVGADGTVTVALTVSGNHAADRDRVPFELATDGFLRRRVDARNGFDAPLPVEQRSDTPTASRFQIRLDTPARAGQNYRLGVVAELVPVGGLFGERDAYVMHVPMKITGRVHSAHRVTLPPGSRVESVDPAPTIQLEDRGRPVLLWDQPIDSGDARVLTATVRFRKDGPLTPEWPIDADAVAIGSAFVSALGNGDRDALATLLSDDFLLSPHDVGKRELLAEPRRAKDRFEPLRIDDVTAVGPIVTLWATADWHFEDRAGRGERVARWPIRIAIERGPSWRVLALQPAGTTDAGRIERGEYVHDDLRVRLQPTAGVTLRRQRGRLTELQVECDHPRRLGAIAFSIAGYRAMAGVDDEQALQVLSVGAFSARPGTRLSDDRTVFGNPEDGGLARVYEWSFGHPLGGVSSHERWTYVAKGRRRFLVCAIARAASASEAAALFASAEAQAFFASMTAGLTIQ